MMRKSVRCILAWGGVLFLSLTAMAKGSPNPLVVSLSASRDAFLVGETIDLTVNIRNNGDETVRLYSPAVSGVSEIKVIDGQNALHSPEKTGDLSLSGAEVWEIPAGEEKQFVYKDLHWNRPDGIYGFEDQAQLGSAVYRIVLTIRCPPAGREDGFPEGLWQGVMTSNLITIKVFEKGSPYITCTDCR